MDTTNHKEFRCSGDGSHIAVGSVDNDVAVLRISDGQCFDHPEASYQFGGHRLALDTSGNLLFSGAYHETGIGAYNLETGEQLWYRRDLKKLQKVVFDPLSGLLYCAFEGKATKPLNADTGREKTPLRGLKDFYFSHDSPFAVFERRDVTIEDRNTESAHSITRESRGILDVAFISQSIVVSWVGGPVTAYDPQTGTLLWRYATEGTHAFSIAPAAEHGDMWVAEQPYKEPPWHRIRRLEPTGAVANELRCALGHSFKLIPCRDMVVRADVQPVRIESLRGS